MGYALASFLCYGVTNSLLGAIYEWSGRDPDTPVSAPFILWATMGAVGVGAALLFKANGRGYRGLPSRGFVWIAVMAGITLSFKLRGEPRVGLVYVGDGATRGAAESTDWLQIDSVQFVAPGRLTVTADTQVRPRPDLRELKDAEARQRLAAGLVNAQVQTTIDNHLPIGVGVSLCVTGWPRIVRDARAGTMRGLYVADGHPSLDRLPLPRRDLPAAPPAAPPQTPSSGPGDAS